MTDIKMNKEWERKMANLKVKVPAGATEKQAAAALAKEMKRKGLSGK